jgi:ABC-type sugar transport system ATPase subunit
VSHGVDADLLLSVAALTVRFGATTALQDVGLELRPGEVHAVVGENGAGKSTLLRAIAGLAPTNGGSVRLATGCELAYVPQETVLPADFMVREWIFLGREQTTWLGRLRRRDMDESAAATLRVLAAQLAPQMRLGELTAVQRKQVQLARAVNIGPDILLLDEPTAVLGARETQNLFEIIRRCRAAGGAVLYVSHRLDEVLAIADRVTVLRDGRRVSTDPVADLDTRSIVQRMVGRDIPPRWRAAPRFGTEVLRIAQASVSNVRDVSLQVRAGEIVGLAGLVGSGRSEILEAVAGLHELRAGSIVGREGAVLVPEDRALKGLVATLTLRENIFLPVDGWRVRRRAEARDTEHWIEQLRIRTTGSEAAIDSLSGGNQQKVLLARALQKRPRVLLLDEPTAGVDVGAKAEIHELIRDLAEAGTAILLASSDLPEMLSLCDRIVALYGGRCVASVDAASASEAQLAALITGAPSATPQPAEVRP